MALLILIDVAETVMRVATVGTPILVLLVVKIKSSFFRIGIEVGDAIVLVVSIDLGNTFEWGLLILFAVGRQISTRSMADDEVIVVRTEEFR